MRWWLLEVLQLLRCLFERVTGFAHSQMQMLRSWKGLCKMLTSDTTLLLQKPWLRSCEHRGLMLIHVAATLAYSLVCLPKSKLCHQISAAKPRILAQLIL